MNSHAEVEGSMVKHIDRFKKKEWVKSVTSKKRGIPTKNNRDRSKKNIYEWKDGTKRN